MSSRALGVVLTLVLALSVYPALAAGQGGPSFPEGWARWRIHAVGGGGRWCCPLALEARDTGACEGHERGSSEWDDPAPARDLLIVAFHHAGALQRLRVVEADCATRVVDAHELDEFDTTSSARWLTGLLQGELAQTALTLLALHDDPTVLETLKGVAREAALDLRETALTWLARTRPGQCLELVRRLMFGDANRRIRKHASFALATINPPTLLADLGALGRDDADAEVRGLAWFWLAQRGPVGSEAALSAALQREASAHVRRQLVFAQSRLPPERATTALLGSLRDRRLPAEARKEAIFWLAESNDARAQAAVSQVLLDDASPRR